MLYYSRSLSLLLMDLFVLIIKPAVVEGFTTMLTLVESDSFIPVEIYEFSFLVKQDVIYHAVFFCENTVPCTAPSTFPY